MGWNEKYQRNEGLCGTGHRLYTMLVEWNVSSCPLGLPTSLFWLYAERFEVVVEFGL
jgi:hypothetical protein